MPIYFQKTEYETAPDGLQPAVCVDVVDIGTQKTKFGLKDMIKIVWQLEAEKKNGFRFIVSQKYNPSKSKKGNLRQMLESWRSRPFTDDEMGGFDIETLIGVNCQITVVHNITDDGTWANVKSVVAAARGAQKLYSLDYVREIERPDYVEPQHLENGPEEKHDQRVPEDDDIPF